MPDRRLDKLEAKLEIYKSTLTEIYERYDQKLEELSLVRRIGDALRSTLTVESLASALMTTVAHEVSADRLALILKDPSIEGPEALRLRAVYLADREDFKFFDRLEAQPWSPDWLGGPEVESLPLQTVERTGAAPLGTPEEGPRSVLLAPFLVRGRFLGLLLLARPADSPFTAENERMISIMADQAGAALSNVQLFDDLSRINAKLSLSERRARESSEYLERLLETANDAILILDAGGRVTYSNRKAAQWGWAKEELLGREFRLLLESGPGLAEWPPGGPPPADRILEATLVNAAGERRVALVSTSGAVGGGREGAAEGDRMIVVSDLTESRQLERQLLHSEKLASIGLLAAGVAHEVGNPLSAISGYAQILEAGFEADDERREYVKAVIAQTERIQKILRDLLDYSRPSRGLLETLDLAERLPRIMALLESQRVFSRIKVVYDLDPDGGPHRVTMDRDHLAQVVVIVAMNAAQAMSGQTAPEPVFRVALAREPGWVVMNLADNGPGMSLEVRRRVFDPFFTTKGPGQGTGLGLAICQRIVDSYRGRLELDSDEGRGAAFAIRWPEAAGPA
ncbi:MAG: PAS domain S-box protein [Deltaproteobacteria bacterium]|jgi:signal transduction histidine kinase|nr:PAS domain S-box protein [Deltaproteobacteria bacterium]